MYLKCFILLLSCLVLVIAQDTENMKNLLARKEYCGLQHSDDFLRKGNSSAITEFPWVARLAYYYANGTAPGKKVFTCLGSLINNMYILTTAWCCTFNHLTLKYVRLGEFYFYHQRDCVNETSVEECSDPPNDYKVEKIIIHPNYNEHLHIDNVALLRLEKGVTYSDYIRPICLSSPGSNEFQFGDIVTTSGWYIDRQYGNAKMSLVGEVIAFEECSSKYKQGYGLTITETMNICTDKLNGSLDMSCYGDFGAPVAFRKNKLQWYQDGIIAYTPKRCFSDYPVILMKVSKYLDWIVNNIEP